MQLNDKENRGCSGISNTKRNEKTREKGKERERERPYIILHLSANITYTMIMHKITKQYHKDQQIYALKDVPLDSYIKVKLHQSANGCGLNILTVHVFLIKPVAMQGHSHHSFCFLY